MKIISEVAMMQRWATHAGLRGEKLALVPTMGCFHEGHLSLMRYARGMSDRVVVSLFVNPAQFGPGEDLSRYPRTLESDVQAAMAAGVDVLFVPAVNDIYAGDQLTWVNVTKVTDGLCGAFRPGHFKGVATIVLKLFNIVRPQIAIFGEKDFQQLQVIKKMVADLNVPVQVISYPTVREADGLAMSSRNTYLSKAEREFAPIIQMTLNWVKKQLESRKASSVLPSPAELIKEISNEILSARRQDTVTCVIEYVFVGTTDTLEPIRKIEAGVPVLIAIAVWVGKTRLIDNEVIIPCTAPC